MELDDELVSTREAARFLGLTNEKTLAVWRSTKRYDLPYVKFGRTVRYRRSALRAFVERRTLGGNSPDNPIPIR